jgi:hypothetical protein
VLKEFDLDAALARRPALILMDELAHSNVAGSRHPKRWQDIHELARAGDRRLQHGQRAASGDPQRRGQRHCRHSCLGDGTRPVFDDADEVVLVDLPPDELLQRLKEGKVYLPQQAERAIRNFFRKGNLIALRELALRRTADRVDDEMLAYRRETSVATVWQTRDALLVCIGSGTGGERLVRTGARLAGRLEAPWHAIHVDTHTSGPEPEVQRQRIVRALELSASLGAETATLSADDPVAALVDYAREQNLSRVLVGRDHPRPGDPGTVRWPTGSAKPRPTSTWCRWRAMKTRVQPFRRRPRHQRPATGWPISRQRQSVPWPRGWQRRWPASSNSPTSPCCSCLPYSSWPCVLAAARRWPARFWPLPPSTSSSCHRVFPSPSAMLNI